MQVPKGEARACLQYAWHLRAVLSSPTAKHMDDVIKVKAHRS